MASVARGSFSPRVWNRSKTSSADSKSASESRRADDEAAAIAAERIRSGATDHKDDGAEALAKLGIEIPKLPSCPDAPAPVEN